MRDEVEPAGKWAFDSQVTDAFDDMFSRSIPEYESMRRLVFNVGCGFVQNQTDVVDLGCARGEALAPFVDKFGAYNRYTGVEISDPMAQACRERFKAYEHSGLVKIRQEDLRTFYPPVTSSLTLSIMTIQFVPIEYRQRIIQNVFRSTCSGGAFILAEKVLGRDDRTNVTLVEEYHRLKKEHGYSQEQIERKSLSLEGVLVPVTAAWNEDLLRTAGFSHVDCFWRVLNFAAWVAIK